MQGLGVWGGVGVVWAQSGLLVIVHCLVVWLPTADQNLYDDLSQPPMDNGMEHTSSTLRFVTILLS